ncbi:hypothetical protein SLS56_000526 [Neofusicoccum ribis]|uniref:Fe2OG dioxygenase domain-containing protein n=1 Tax=Neofusicoccum ribis TaxID=45134 RepID=A0ABR3TCY7_9PEZI
MGKTRYTERTIPRISLRDFDSRVDEITAELVRAAETDGFFSLADTGISVEEIEVMFNTSERFFALPEEQKATVPWSPKNVGWEKNAQIRPSTGTADMKVMLADGAKESYQLQFGSNMKDPDSWISEQILPGFKPRAREFMFRTQAVSEKVMLCLARGLGFADDYFIKAHDVSRPEAQSVLRLIHYPAQDKGQSGLEICPGRESVTEFGIGDEWTKVDFAPGDIVCNIGDLLMSWSDDRFKSTFHRVKAPEDPDADYWGPRYSMAFFNQPCWDCKIQGPKKKYPMVTGEEFNRNAMQRNFAALKAKTDAIEREKTARAAAQAVPANISVGA